MGLIKRIQEGTTTVRDAEQVSALQFLAKPKALILGFVGIGLCLIGFAVGGLFF